MSSADIISGVSKPSSSHSSASSTSSTKSMASYDDVPVKTSGRDAPSPIEKWSDADLGKTLLNNIEDAGYAKPTPVQKHSIPIVMKTRDLMGCAQTGSGKTAAFLLPIIAKMHAKRDFGRRERGAALPTCLILAPTRELVSQIYDEACKFAHKTGIRSAVIYGGTPLHKSIQTVHSGCDILVATPGRLVDLMQKKEVSVSSTKYLVLDEADRMLDMGFEPQIRQIVEKSGMPSVGQRQTLMFSATFPTEIQQLASSFLKDYVFLTVGRVGAATTLVAQKFMNVDSYGKQNALLDLIRSTRGLTLIFVETKKKASQLERFLTSQGFAASSIHGDREQRDRERALRAFSTGQTPFLIATNVAARGLDIDNVTHVINFDMPANIDDYVHRIGRTGRAGKAGVSTSFISDKDLGVVPKLLDLLYDNNQEPPSWLVNLGHTAKYNRDMKMRNKKPRYGAKDFRQEFSATKYSGEKEGYDKDKDYGRAYERDEGPLAKRFKPEGSSSSGLPVNTSNVSTFLASAANGNYNKTSYPSSSSYGNSSYSSSNGNSSSYGSYPSSSSSSHSSSYPPSTSSNYPPSTSSYPPSNTSYSSSSNSSSSSHYPSGPRNPSSSYSSSHSGSYPSTSSSSSHGSSYSGPSSSSTSSGYTSRWDKRKRDDYEPSSSSNGSSYSNGYSNSAPSSSYGSSSYSNTQQPNTQSAYYYAQAYAQQPQSSSKATDTGSSSSSTTQSSGSTSQSSNPQAYDLAYQYQQYYQNYYQNYYPTNGTSSSYPTKPSTASSTSSSSTQK